MKSIACLLVCCMVCGCISPTLGAAFFAVGEEQGKKIEKNLTKDDIMSTDFLYGKPVRAIDGYWKFSVWNSDELPGWAIPRANDQSLNTNALGGIGLVPLDSYSVMPGGTPALITTDPTYLAMGATRPTQEQLDNYHFV